MEDQVAYNAHIAVQKEFILKDGRKVVILKGKGRDAREATKIAGTDTSMIVPALMSRLVRIDGQQILAEDFDELDLNDYMQIQKEFGDFLL